jgi:hypothetical protein
MIFHSKGISMRHGQSRASASSDGDLVQYADTIARMQRALHRIYANKKAISDSLLRSAAALRTIAAAGSRHGNPGASSTVLEAD